MKITRSKLRRLIKEEEEASSTKWVDRTWPLNKIRDVIPDEDQATMRGINQSIADADPTGIAQATVDTAFEDAQRYKSGRFYDSMKRFISHGVEGETSVNPEDKDETVR